MRPKFLLTHPDGALMVEKILQAEEHNKYDRVVVTITRAQEKHDALLILQQLQHQYSFEVCLLDGPTKHEPETIMKTIEVMSITGGIVVHDVDSYVVYQKPTKEASFVVGVDMHELPDPEVLNKSYIVLHNDTSIVKKVIERRVVSSIICTGVYGFASVDRFFQTYIDCENLYLSNMISTVADLDRVHFIKCSEYEDWGTLARWNKYKKKHRTFFVDIDGVVVVNRGKYGKATWDAPPIVLEKNVQILQDLERNGAKIVFTTARPQELKDVTETFLTTIGFKHPVVVYGCTHAERILVNDFATSNPYPSCVAIPIPRDGNLWEYLDCND